MKRIIAGIMAFVICLVCVAGCFAEDDLEGIFEARLLPQLELSAGEWFASRESRATLTLLLAMELKEEIGLDTDVIASFIAGESIVGRSSTVLIVLYSCHEGHIFASYSVQSDMIDWSYFKTALPNGVNEGFFKSEGIDYYYNDFDDILNMAGKLNEIMNN